MTAELHICSSSGSQGSSSYAGVIAFNPRRGMVFNPQWNDHDHTPVVANQDNFVSTWFQAVPNEPNATFELDPILRKTSKLKYPDPASSTNPNAITVRVGGGTAQPTPHVAGPPESACGQTSPPPPPTPTPLYEVTNNTVTDLSTGLAVPSYTTVQPNAPLSSGVDVCATANVTRTNIRVGVKFVAVSAGLNVAPWEDEPFARDDLTAWTWGRFSTVWYQNAPKQSGVYQLIPRVFASTGGDTPDSGVLAEGPPFVFCVVVNPCSTGV